jgi:hypothetical protein
MSASQTVSSGFHGLGILLSAIVLVIMGCDQVTVTTGDIASSDLEELFRKHKVEGYNAVALKKRSLGSVAYLATIHGFSNNRSVCEELITPYNKDPSLSVIPGEYFCEELR